MDPLADPGARDIHSPTSEFILNLGVWGDATRRHQSIEAKGSRATKTGADYQASTATSRVPAYANFFAEIKIVKCMRERERERERARARGREKEGEGEGERRVRERDDMPNPSILHLTP